MKIEIIVMISLFKITTPASDISLLTSAEMRTACSITGNGSDGDLRNLENMVVARLARTVRLRTDTITPPTFRPETITEQFRWGTGRFWAFWRTAYTEAWTPSQMVLSRKPIVNVISVVEDGVTLVEDEDYEVQAAGGVLVRIWNDIPTFWIPSKIIVVYEAGWQTVPYDLKFAAQQLLRAYWFNYMMNPLIKSITVPGVIARTYNTINREPDIPQNVLDILAPYTYYPQA